MGSEGIMKNQINIVQTSVSWMYLVKSKALGYELAEDWMLFWTFFMPLALILNMFPGGDILIYKGLICLLLIFVMTIVRRNIISSLKYLLVNILIVVFVFIISFTLIERFVFGGSIILYFFLSVKKRNKEVIEFYNISMLLLMEFIMLICYFIAFNYKLTLLMNLINFSSINIAITCALYLYFSSTSRLYEWEGEYIKGYSERMKKIKRTCVVFISGSIIAFVLIAWKIGLYELFDDFTSKILAFFNASRAFEIKPITKAPVVNKITPNLGDGLKNLNMGGKTSNLVKALLNIASLILWLVIISVVIYFLFYLLIKIRDFYRSLRLNKTYEKEDTESLFSLEDIKTEIKERADKLMIPFNLPFNLSNRKKIRKMYYKLIKLYKTKGLPAYNFNTPNEIQGKVREVLDKDISDATLIYERARYSKGECSKEDVDKMKKLI